MRKDAFDRLYAEHAEALLGFLIYRTADRALAEDVLADTFERALRGRRGFDRRKASEKTWLYTIALNCLRDHARRRGAEQRALERVSAETAPVAADPIGPADDRDAVNRALETLTEEERTAVALRYGADLTVPEIARLTGLPESTARGRVYGAMAKLRDQLDPR